MSEQLPPPAPQVSPDGKFYWDGLRWLPMQQQAGPPATPVAARSKGVPFVTRTTYLTLVGLGSGLVVLLLVAGLCSSLMSR